MVNPVLPLGTVLPNGDVNDRFIWIDRPCCQIAFFFLALAAAPGWASAGTILVFGDSLSAGYGLPQERGWVHLLEKRVKDEDFTYRVANASVSGETTGGGANRIAAALKTHQPDIVVIELGANDGLRGQSLEIMRRNLEAMIDASRHAKARVLLVGMRLPPNYGTAYTEKFQQAYADLARSKKTALRAVSVRRLRRGAATFKTTACTLRERRRRSCSTRCGRG